MVDDRKLAHCGSVLSATGEEQHSEMCMELEASCPCTGLLGGQDTFGVFVLSEVLSVRSGKEDVLIVEGYDRDSRIISVCRKN